MGVNGVLLVDRKKLLSLVVHCSTMMPFKWTSARYTCFYCSLAFTESSKLKTHTISEHGNENLQSSIKQITYSTRLKLDISSAQCKICGESVKDLNDFLDHLSENHKCLKFNRKVSECFKCFKLADDILPCLECDEVFRFFGPLLMHLYRKHEHNKTHICDICGIFVDRGKMLYHSKTVHGNNTSKVKHCPKTVKQCPKCPQVFRSNYSRSKHLGVDHNMKSAQYVCNVCGFMFVYKNRLVRHQLRVHGKEKGFRCAFCGFVTFNKDSLSRHIIVRHSDHRPYECEHCSKIFQRRKYLITHLKIHTNEVRRRSPKCPT